MKKLFLFICLAFSSLSFSQSIFGSKYTKCLEISDSLMVDSLHNASNKASTSGNYREALRLEKQVLEIRRSKLGTNHEDYILSLGDLAMCYADLADFSEALDLVEQGLKIYKKKASSEKIWYSFLLELQAEYQSALGNEKEVVRRHIQPMIDSLQDISIKATVSGKYLEAARFEKQILEIRGRELGIEHEDYVLSLCNLADTYSESGNYSEAVHYSELALDIYGKTYGTNNLWYSGILHNLAVYHSGLGNDSIAESYYLRAMENYGKVYGTDHPEYAGILKGFATEQFNIGNYPEALRLEEQILDIYDYNWSDDHPCYIASLGDIAKNQFYLGNIAEAIRLKKQELELICKELHIEYSDYVLSSNKQSMLQVFNGYYCTFAQVGVQVVKLILRNFCVEHPEYTYDNRFDINYVDLAMTLIDLADYLSVNGDYFYAVFLYEKALEICSTEYSTIHPVYIMSLIKLSSIQLLCGNDSEAIKLSLRAFDLCCTPEFEKEYIEYQQLFFTCERIINLHYFEEYREAVIFELQALEKFGIGGFDDTQLHTIRAACYYNLGNIRALNESAYNCTNEITDIIIMHFPNLTAYKREKLWSKYSNWYTKELNVFTYRYPTDTLCMTAYNSALLSKGLLLNSEIELKKLLQESGNAVVDSLYEEMRINKLMLQRQYEKPITERCFNTDSIEKKVNKIEEHLMLISRGYGEYMDNLRIDYKDVRGKLKDGDLAIEFCSFPLSKDSTMYMALVLRNDMEYPKMVPLFEEKQISKLRKDIYKGGYTATLVWKPLEQYLNKAKNVYFGPSGELYNIAIENIPHWSEDCLMSDKWNIYRLSSTRELAVIRDKDAVRKATVYGGIVYDTGTDVLTADTLRYGRQRSVFYGLYNLSDSLSVRGGVEYLPATKEEAEYVDDALKGRHIASTLRTDMQATEGAFKDMAGKRNNLLHIATHAFYWPEKEVVTTDKDFLFMPNMPQRYKEDKAMTRSGLILAGANNALRGMKLPEDVNDGILTAKEIAQLDLRGLDLVVLSACQTGLGEVTGDGVFGLQRGFKKAGANSLMMSLWNVDDEATSLFMKEFYRQLMAGNGKHESMKAAQRHVREYSEIDEDGEVTHPYENYRYWAAFVLLDAIR